MKTAPMTSFLLVLVLAAWGVPSAHASVSDEILAMHWHPATAAEARLRTLAAAAWLENERGPIENWQSAVNARKLMLSSARDRIRWEWTPLADGLFAWFVQVREHNLLTDDASFPEPGLDRLPDLLQRPSAAGRIGRLSRIAALRTPEIWSRVERRLEEEGRDAGTEIDAFWDALRPAVSEPGTGAQHGRSQAARILQISRSDTDAVRAGRIAGLLREEAAFEWERDRPLHAMWLLLEGLGRLAHADDPRERAQAYVEWLAKVEDAKRRELRTIDVDLPVVLALLQDAADHLVSEETRVLPALTELADAYARLALFAPDAGFYLDQPVREDLRSVVADCNPDPLLMEPLPREVYERCVQRLIDVLEQGVGSDELVGGAQGPFAPEFLRRELGLVSWQRAAYIDGHLGWMLDAPCEPPEWINVLDWSLMVDHLERWVRQRPVFFASIRWQEALESLQEQASDRARIHGEWIDCLTGQGSERRDPVLRLLRRHEGALDELTTLLGEARQEFYSSHVRAGGDIDLDGPADQETAYRPETISVGPCPETDTCGVRAELPVSRALLGLFPNAYLLADQLGMGQLRLCYDQVGWVDRASSPARDRDERVAHYHGRLRFELVGAFDHSDQRETIFRHRLVDSEISHYLFAADEPEILALECPHELIGTAVASSMPEGGTGLVPNRLTYFASAPVTAEARLVANWARGAEWRDWFITGSGVEVREALDGHDMEVAVRARLTELSAQRERQLSAPLAASARAGQGDPLALAMTRVADSTAMLRRLVEIHYPRVIRHHDPVRALLVGEAGLMTRDRVRTLREEGTPMIRVPVVGLERARSLRDVWTELAPGMREHGQRAPEMDYGLERLERLMRISRYEPSVPREGR